MKEPRNMLVFMTILCLAISTGIAQGRKENFEISDQILPRENSMHDKYPFNRVLKGRHDLHFGLKDVDLKLTKDFNAEYANQIKFKAQDEETKNHQIFEDNKFQEYDFDFQMNSRKKDDSFPPINPAQNTWQLPVSKVNITEQKTRSLKILPFSALHEIWLSTKRFLSTDAQETVSPSTNSPDNTLLLHNSMNKSSESPPKGELMLNTAEGRGWQPEEEWPSSGMKGGQQILLIKDKGGNEGEMNGNGANGKDAIAPLIMLITPLIMMCIMMSLMAGMMNSMKSMMMMMPNNPMMPVMMMPVHKEKYRNDENELVKGRHSFGSFLLELLQNLDVALNKTDEMKHRV